MADSLQRFNAVLILVTATLAAAVSGGAPGSPKPSNGACPSGYNLVDGGCVPKCPLNQWPAPAGPPKCFPCPQGYQTDPKDRINCAPCPKNTFNPTSGASCKPCPKGYITRKVGAQKCVRKPVAKASPKPRASPSLKPPAKPSPKPSPKPISSPSPSPSPIVAPKPINNACPYWGWKFESGKCVAYCKINQFATSLGHMEYCADCPAGMASTPGAYPYLDCSNCTAGTFNPKDAGGCLPCPKGTTSGPGATTCVPVRGR